jgi:hypothetical protein
VQFSDVGLGNGSADVMLDTVTIALSGPLIVNGNFETAPFDKGGSVTGWTVGGAKHIEAVAEGATSGTHSAGFGTGGDSQGSTLSQTFATVNGQKYALDFDAGVIGQHNGSTALKLRAQVTGTGTLVDQTVTPLEAGTYTASLVKFQHYHYEFTANSGSATLQFTDVGLGNAAADTVIDTVAIRTAP